MYIIKLSNEVVNECWIATLIKSYKVFNINVNVSMDVGFAIVISVKVKLIIIGKAE